MKYTVKKSLKADDKKFPINSKKYPSAHRKANEAEKSRYHSGFKKLTALEHHLGKNELLGKSTKSGEIEVSRKVPAKYRKEVALHEKVENKQILSKGNKHANKSSSKKRK